MIRLFLLKSLTFFCRLALRLRGGRGLTLGRGGWVHGLVYCRLKPGARVEIGDNVTLCSLARFNPLAPEGRVRLVGGSDRARIVIGPGAGISSSLLSCHERITIGPGAMIGANCVIADSDFHEIPLRGGAAERHAPVEIGANVFIGTRSIVLKGVTIGDGAVIGAGSVVTRSIPAHSLAAGNPARVIRRFPEEGRAAPGGTEPAPVRPPPSF